MYIQHPETDFFYRELHQPGENSWVEVLLRGVTVRGVPLV